MSAPVRSKQQSGVPTRGLTHIAVAVADPARSARFYGRVLGARVVYRTRDFVQLQTPGSFDVLVFERDAARAGRSGGILHFGFRLMEPDDVHLAVKRVRAAGGTITGQGEFVPGEPYLFARDPDGYTIEIWFERPTPVDPPVRSARRRSAPSRPSRTRS